MHTSHAPAGPPSEVSASFQHRGAAPCSRPHEHPQGWRLHPGGRGQGQPRRTAALPHKDVSCKPRGAPASLPALGMRSAARLRPNFPRPCRYDLVEDPASDPTVAWGADGQRCAQLRALGGALGGSQAAGWPLGGRLQPVHRRRPYCAPVARRPASLTAAHLPASSAMPALQLHCVEARRVCTRPAPPALQAQQLLQLRAPAQHLCECRAVHRQPGCAAGCCICSVCPHTNLPAAM